MRRCPSASRPRVLTGALLLLSAAPASGLELPLQLSGLSLAFAESRVVRVGASTSEEIVSVPRETVVRRIVAANGRAWRAACDLEISSGALIVRVGIHLVPDGSTRRLQVDLRKAEWERGIEKVWDRAFGLAIAPGVVFPIRVDASFRGPHFHHTVIVRNAPPAIDQLNWSWRSPPPVIAHEFGHMIGVYDEYPKGGTDPLGAVTDPESIMTTRPAGGRAFERHYHLIRAWAAERLGDPAVRIVPLADRVATD
ncbi:MAG: hypothetical protein ACE5FG_10475 [Myxococcota bacterium]